LRRHDRKYKYENVVTGEVQWEKPNEEEETKKEEPIKESDSVEESKEENMDNEPSQNTSGMKLLSLSYLYLFNIFLVEHFCTTANNSWVI